MNYFVIEEAFDVGYHWINHLYMKLITMNPRHNFQLLTNTATNYHQWAAAAQQLDSLDNLDAWKSDPTSKHYEFQLLQDRLDQLRKARSFNDIEAMLFLLRTSLSRNLGNIGNPKLYGVARIGTKYLIDDYINEVTTQLDLLCEWQEPCFTRLDKYLFFKNTQRAFGKTALLLSGGAIFGLTHIGVVKSLLETQLLPRIISGASVGSIVAAVICTRKDDELPVMLDPTMLNLNVFERPSERGGWLMMAHRLIENHVLLDIQVFVEAMRENLGDLTFLDAFNYTRRVLNITVSSSGNFEMPRLLNYLTSPNVLIWSAVCASCSIPGVYESTPLMYKDKSGDINVLSPSGHKWIDGSVENDLPMARISELFGVNHFLVSQVNPHVSPALRLLSIPYCGSLIKTSAFLFWSEIQHWLNQSLELGFSNSLLLRAQSIVKQKYVGDITIVPAIPLYKLTEIMQNPTPEMILYYTMIGERATYPLISTIRTHCQIEMTLEDMLNRLRTRNVTYFEKTRDGRHQADRENVRLSLNGGSAVSLSSLDSNVCKEKTL